MSQSLSPECTPLKKVYDSCFNSWFEGYLEPAIAASTKPEQRTEYAKRKAEEFQANCGKVWEQYKACVQGAVKEKGLDQLLEQAREENPLMEPTPPSK
ncbi:mitochondrial distribution/morphology family 35/apoptosis [Crepidotus variabilis]|uniref:Mitochondrial distribution/morphology family 35/apoptosis n=1 Tax=Crepidotus variabilis TaxID=179855 RepID=A0A9P6ED70_9AGAR|nr:mitochondrial distribution/morphology family 35/apoptosis [Crepidotus variabilis]